MVQAIQVMVVVVGLHIREVIMLHPVVQAVPVLLY
jgi:hypothetical protein